MADPVYDVNNLPMLKEFKNKLSVTKIVRSNIVAFGNDMLYVWITKDRVLFASRFVIGGVLEDTGYSGYQFQTLKPATRTIPEVQSILLNDVGTQIAAVGRKSLNVFTLPARWGSSKVFRAGEPEIYINCTTIKPLDYSKDFEINRVRWFNPGDMKYISALAILSSDNFFRVYDSESLVQLKILQLGRQGRVYRCLSDESGFVDFDFGAHVTEPALPPGSKKILRSSDYGWPVFLLRSNGDVYTTMVNLATPLALRWDDVRGPLRVTPQSSDNYGVDARTILVLDCGLPLVAIMASNGNIYHFVLLPHNNTLPKLKPTDVFVVEPIVAKPSDKALYAVECVELQIDMCQDYERNPLFTRVDLIKDPFQSNRYICHHNAGVHIIKLQMVSALRMFLVAEKKDEKNALSRIMEATSIVEHALCTNLGKTEPALTEQGMCLTVPPDHLYALGVCIISPPDHLFVLLNDGQAVLTYITVLEQPYENMFDSLGKPKYQINFMTIIHDIFAYSNVRKYPVLKLGPAHDIEQYRELLNNTIASYRKDMLAVHKKARDEIDSRVKVLHLMKAKQQEALKLLIERKEERKNIAEQLANKYEDINEKQQELTQRMNKLLMNAYLTCTDPSLDVNLYRRKVLEKMDQIKAIQKKFTDMRERALYFSEQNQQLQIQEQQRTHYLTNSQSSCIRQSLSNMEQHIQNLMTRVGNIKQNMRSQGMYFK